MLFATQRGPKSNALARQALNSALLFDNNTDVSDISQGYSAFLNRVMYARAYINSGDASTGTVETTPISGKLGNYYYPAKSPALIQTSDADQGQNVYSSLSATLTAAQIVQRYFTVQDATLAALWSVASSPVYNGQNGSSVDTSVVKYWPSSCLMLVPKNKRSSAKILYTYSSRAANMYSRVTDSFWGTYSGDDGGYCNAALDLTTSKEIVSSGQVIQSTSTPQVTANLPAMTVANDNLLLVRPISHRYTNSGLNQFSNGIAGSGYATTGNTGFNRNSADAFNMRIDADTSLPDDADVVLAKAVCPFVCGPTSYLLIADIGQGKGLEQQQPTPVATKAVLTTGVNTDFMTNQTVFSL